MVGSKIAREIAEAARDDSPYALADCAILIRIDRLEALVAAKLEPFRELLKRIKSDVVCEGVPLVEPEYDEHDNICSPRMALCSIGVKARAALSLFEEEE